MNQSRRFCYTAGNGCDWVRDDVKAETLAAGKATGEDFESMAAVFREMNRC